MSLFRTTFFFFREAALKSKGKPSLTHRDAHPCLTSNCMVIKNAQTPGGTLAKMTGVCAAPVTQSFGWRQSRRTDRNRWLLAERKVSIDLFFCGTVCSVFKGSKLQTMLDSSHSGHDVSSLCRDVGVFLFILLLFMCCMFRFHSTRHARMHGALSSFWTISICDLGVEHSC